MPIAERWRTTGMRYSAGQFLFCTMASQTPGLSARCFAAKENKAGSACSRLIASTNDSMGCERIASCARSDTISSASPASTAKSSARSAGARCAPPAQMANLRSRVARPWRKSSISSGLSGSTGCLPQILLAEHHCTGGAGRAKRRHRLPVQFQQYGRRAACGHFKLLFGAEAARLAGGQLGIEQQLVIRQDAHARCSRSGNREFERRISRRGGASGRTILSSRLRWRRGNRGLLRGAMRSVASPAIPACVEKSNHNQKDDENRGNGKPFRRRWNSLFRFGRLGCCLAAAGHVVFAEERFLIEAEITRDGTHKPAAEDAARQLLPVFIFESQQEAGADARGFGELFQRNFAHLALALQAFAKISPGHEPEPALDDPSATEKRLTRRALAKNRRGIPERTIGGAVSCCQTKQLHGCGKRCPDPGDAEEGDET